MVSSFPFLWWDLIRQLHLFGHEFDYYCCCLNLFLHYLQKFFKYMQDKIRLHGNYLDTLICVYLVYILLL